MTQHRHFKLEATAWVQREGPVRCIRLVGDFSGLPSFVTETPGGVFINGNCTVGSNHGCGTYDRKTLAWLRSARGDYLHQRFLEKGWREEVFVQRIRELREDPRSAEDSGYDMTSAPTPNDLHFTDWTPDTAFNAWEQMGGEADDFPGYALNPKDCALLDEIALCVDWLMSQGGAS